MVSLQYCGEDDNDCVIDNDITGGHWKIGTIFVQSEDKAEDLLPHQVRSWKYYDDELEWQSDSLLTVTGNINIDILRLYIDIISTVEGAPGYPESLTVKDKTGDRANFAGVYRRQGDSRVWKYGDNELSFNGKH